MNPRPRNRISWASPVLGPCILWSGDVRFPVFNNVDLMNDSVSFRFVPFATDHGHCANLAHSSPVRPVRPRSPHTSRPFCPYRQPAFVSRKYARWHCPRPRTCMQPGTWPVNWFPAARAPEFLKNARPVPVCAAARQHCVSWQRCAARECCISRQPCAPAGTLPSPTRASMCMCICAYCYRVALGELTPQKRHSCRLVSRDRHGMTQQPVSILLFPRPQPPTPRIHTSAASSIDRPVPDAWIQAAAVQREPCDQIRPMSPLHRPPPLSAP